jgi:hypothetical protein
MNPSPAFVRPPRRATLMQPPSRQAGYGMLLALVVLVLGSLYGLMQGLSEATAQNKREDHDQAVLRQARDALIAYAALRDTRPGALPCPDLNDNGIMGGPHPTNVAWNVPEPFGTACNVPQNRTGRLPWRTLDLPDLRDSAGERLWYALSNNFRNISSNKINSDVRGELTVTGLAPQNEVIAVIFAPGAALSVGGVAQDRSPAGRNIAANYLEGENGDTVNDLFATLTACVSADCPAGPFNDKVLVIRARDLFPVVENMVAKRMQTQLRDAMFKEGSNFSEKGHYQRWRDHSVDPAPTPPPPPTSIAQGYFPFAAPFIQPDTSNFQGAWNTLNGLMPVAKDVTTPTYVPFVKWEITDATFRPSVAELGVTTYVSSATCNTSTDDQIVCDVLYSDNRTPQVSITGYALNVSGSFVDPVQRANVTISTTATQANPIPPPATIPCPAPPLPASVSNTHITTAGVTQGSARVEVVLTLPNCDDSSSKPVRIVVTKPPYNTTVLGPSTSTDWFFNNNWHHVTLYSVAPTATTAMAKDATTGNPVCPLPNDPNCLDAVNTANGGPNRHLLLLLSGIPVDGTTPRPAAALGRYLEGRNDWPSAAHTPANQFETYRGGLDQTRRVPGNDRLAVIAP